MEAIVYFCVLGPGRGPRETWAGPGPSILQPGFFLSYFGAVPGGRGESMGGKSLQGLVGLIRPYEAVWAL